MIMVLSTLFSLVFDIIIPTNHALINETEGVRKNLDKGKRGCGIFLDLQKAFDTVDHKILLVKLDHCRIRGVANDS